MTPRRVGALLGCCALLGSLFAPPARAQGARGTILGHVQDPSGATVPGATVTAQNVATSISTTFKTTGSGDYVFVNMLPGTYLITCQATGFKTAVSRNVILQVDQTLRVNFQLEVGSLSQQVAVSAAAQMLQTDNATVGQVVSNRLIQALPLNGRDFTSLVAINAGVTTPAGGIQTSVFDQHGLNPSFREMSVDGARPASIDYLIDGVTDSDFFFAKATAVPSQYAVQEFKLQNGLYSAEYGNGSAQVNVAIRSGSNQWHGNAYDFLRNDAFQPRSPIIGDLNALNGTHNPEKIPLKQNQFGFSLGGPAILPFVYHGRNRTFWFFNYEGGRLRQGGGIAEFQAPTKQELSGNFSDWPYPIYDPSTTGSVGPTATDPSGRTQFSNNAILPSEINPISQKILSYFPVANVSCQLPCLNFAGPLPSSPTNTDTVTARVDHHFSSSDQISYTMIVENLDQTFPNIVPVDSTEAFSRTRLFGINWQHTFAGTAFNELRLGYNRDNFHEGAVTAFGPNLSSQLGLANTTSNPAMYGLPNVGVGDGYFGLGQGNNGYSQKDNIYQVVDNFKFIRGNKTFTFGADIRRLQLWDIDGFTANGSLSFTGAYTASCPPAFSGCPTTGKAGPTSGNGFADLLLGYPLSVGAPVPLASDLYNLRGTSVSLFAEDDWLLTPRLTLNLGIRYELPAPLHDVTDSGSILNPNYPGGGLTWVSKSFVQAVGPGSANPTGQSTYFQCCVSNQLVPRQVNDFAPRIGFAWRPLHSAAFVLRGGYGMFYDTYMRFYDGTNFDANELFTLQANPNYPSATGGETASPLVLKTLWLPPVTINPFSTLPPHYHFFIQTEWPYNKSPYNEQWSLDAQYALTPTMMLDVGYVGQHGLHEPIQWHFNQAYPPPVAGDPCNYIPDVALIPASGPLSSCGSDPNFVPIDKRDPFPNFDSRSYANANILSSTYNALQVRLEKRFSRGLTFLANYTWSRALDEASEIAAFSATSNFIQDAHNARGSYGPADFNQTHRLVFSYDYALPIGRGQHWSLGPLNWVLGDWNTSGILTFASGLPTSVYCCNRGGPFGVDQFGNLFGDRTRANLTGSPSVGSKQSLLEWFNPLAFSTPTPGTLGDSGRNIITVPGQRQGDISFVKQWPIRESQNLTYRLEIFNVFSSWHTGQWFPTNRLTADPANCTPGLAGPGGCPVGSLVPLNGLGKTNLWTPRILQMALIYSF